MHVGNLRTALFNFLFTKKNNGKFLLRIEDTDSSRSDDNFKDSILKLLLELDLNYDDSVLYQSANYETYHHYSKILLENKSAYKCYCSNERLNELHAQQSNNKLPPRYDGKCKSLSNEDIQTFTNSNQKFVLRFNVPNKLITFNDLVKKNQTFKSENLDDFVILKSDKSPSFLFANAIDDSLSKVTHVLRGEDHLSNTPKQLLILDKLGLKSPLYGHLPIILGSDGKPLSKRNGSEAIKSFLNTGYLPLALLNYIARLGHTYDENKIYNLLELTKYFDVTKVTKSPSKFDIEQLDYYQNLIWKKQINEEFDSKYLGELTFSNNEQKQMFTTIIKENTKLPYEVYSWYSSLYENKIFSEEDLNHINELPKDFIDKLFNFNSNNLLEHIEHLSALKVVKKGIIFKTIRKILTNRKDGPKLNEIIQLLTKDQIVNKFIHVKEQLDAII